MKRILKISMWVVVAAVFAGTFVYMWMHSRAKELTYYTVKPSTGVTVERTTVLSGTIEPRDEIEIKPQISGIVAEISVEAGQMVNAGDVIAKIKVIPDEAQLSSAKSRINAARISLSDAETRHKRNTALYENKAISREEYERTLVEVEKCREDLHSAQNDYAIVKEGVSPDNATGSNTLVRATTSGLVLDVPVKVGASVIQANTFNDGTTIATIADMSRLIFKGSVDETEVGNLSVGQPMRVTVGALPDLELDAVTEYISPKSSSTSGANTFEIKGAVNAPGNTQLRAGYSANASVTLQSVAGVMTVPEKTVEFSGDSAFVYVQTDSAKQTYRRTAVVTGLSDGINIEIKSGITADARVRADESND